MNATPPPATPCSIKTLGASSPVIYNSTIGGLTINGNVVKINGKPVASTTKNVPCSIKTSKASSPVIINSRVK
jgi:hypothetical protein